MIQIRFRAKILGHVGYVYGVPHNVYNSDVDSNLFDSIQYLDDNGKPCVEYIVSDTISQFTGLKDKKGTDIYEGDILEGCFINGHNSVVIKDSGCFCIKSLREDIISFSTFREMAYSIKRGEIIGNIYKNPELINS